MLHLLEISPEPPPIYAGRALKICRGHSLERVADITLC
jgi:hypothetical protein